MSHQNNQNLFEYIKDRMSKEEREDVELKLVAGLNFAGISEGLELEFVGTSKQWEKYEELKREPFNDLPF